MARASEAMPAGHAARSAGPVRRFRLRKKDERGMTIGSSHFIRKQIGVEDEPHPVTGMPVPIFEEIEVHPGEEVESNRDLKALFPGRFDLVGEEGAMASEEDKDAEIRELKARIAELENHGRPEVLNSVETPEAFVQSRGPTPEEVSRALEAKAAEEDEDEDLDEGDAMASHEGKPKKDKRVKDVTADYEGASEAGFSVFEKKNGRKTEYAIYSQDDEKKPAAKHLKKTQIKSTLDELK